VLGVRSKAEIYPLMSEIPLQAAILILFSAVVLLKGYLLVKPGTGE